MKLMVTIVVMVMVVSMLYARVLTIEELEKDLKSLVLERNSMYIDERNERLKDIAVYHKMELKKLKKYYRDKSVKSRAVLTKKKHIAMANAVDDLLDNKLPLFIKRYKKAMQLKSDE